jgi:hypothetical protein
MKGKIVILVTPVGGASSQRLICGLAILGPIRDRLRMTNVHDLAEMGNIHAPPGEPCAVGGGWRAWWTLSEQDRLTRAVCDLKR